MKLMTTYVGNMYTYDVGRSDTYPLFILSPLDRSYFAGDCGNGKPTNIRGRSVIPTIIFLLESGFNLRLKHAKIII